MHRNEVPVPKKILLSSFFLTIILALAPFGSIAIPKQVHKQGTQIRDEKSGSQVGASTTDDKQKGPVQARSALVITLKASREQPAAGSDFGISADIENVSDQAVYLNPRGFTMTAPPELDPDGPADWWAWLPGLYVGNSQSVPSRTQKDNQSVPNQTQKNKAPDPSPDSNYDKVVVISAHSKMSAFWRAPNTSNPLQQFFHGLLFSPGKYTISVVGSYWDTADGAKLKTIEHRTEIASIELPIVASESTILFGAAVGGIFAFLLVPRTIKYPDYFPAKATIYAGHLISSVLLSVIVTILLARLSETQFLVKVSINDFWGAITIGFIVGVYGLQILKKILGENSPTEESRATKTTEGTAPKAPQTKTLLSGE